MARGASMSTRRQQHRLYTIKSETFRACPRRLRSPASITETCLPYRRWPSAQLPFILFLFGPFPLTCDSTSEFGACDSATRYSWSWANSLLTRLFYSLPANVPSTVDMCLLEQLCNLLGLCAGCSSLASPNPSVWLYCFSPPAYAFV